MIKKENKKYQEQIENGDYCPNQFNILEKIDEIEEEGTEYDLTIKIKK